ncbi:MAG: hypothetical protein JXB36_19585 [Gammaproteobacteria bacterium]|nr:hypothetical protein [Gammaproteobacteria bacterium]
MAFRLDLVNVPIAFRIAVSIALAAAQPAAAQSLIYSDSSTREKLQSKLGVGVDGELSLQAGVTMIGEDGVTRVLPRVTSEWSGLEFLDVGTVLSYEDLNAAGGAAEPGMDTTIALSSDLGVLDGIEGKFRRSGTAADDTLKVNFAELDTDLALFGGDAFGVDADVVMHSAGEARRTTSNIVSSWGVGRALDVETVVSLQDGMAGGSSHRAVSTSFVYESPVVFVDKLEGAVKRSPDGVRQSLGLRFTEFSSGDSSGSSFSISSRAIVEEMLEPDGAERLSMGVETRLSNVLPTLLGGSSSLSLRIDRELNEIETQTSTLAYDHAWSPGAASIGLNLKLLRGLDEEVEPSMGVTWSARF